MTALRRARSRAERQRILLAHGHKCGWCGCRIDPSDAWDLDHIIPLEISGDDSDRNLQPIHRFPCHREKTSRDRRDIAKCQRVAKKHSEPLGQKKTRSPLPFGRNSPQKKKVDGTIVWRDDE